MSGDLLESGVERPPRARRRLAAGLGVVLAAGAATLLAVRANPERVAAPPRPSPTAVVVPRPVPADAPAVVVVDMAASGDDAYVLVGHCGDEPCRLEILARDGGRPWRPLGPRLPAVGQQGFAQRLVAGPGVLAVVDEDTRRVTVVRGRSVTTVPLTRGRPVPAVPAGSVVEELGQQLTAFDPATGVRARLATQPPVGALSDVSVAGTRIGALGIGPGGRVLTAFSADAGRTWSAVSPAVRPAPQVTRLASGPDGTAWLVVGRETYDDVLNEFTELWRFDGRRWTDVTPRTRPRSAMSLLVHDGRLMLTEEHGGLWERRPDGTLRRLPGPVSEGAELPPAYLVPGPPGTVLAYATDAANRSAVLTRWEDHWDVYVPA